MLGSSLLALGASTKDCEHWATMGECEKNPGFMKTGCASACARLLLDTLPAEECARIWEEGGCARPSTLSQCKTTCLSRLKPTVTDDGEGNCWYWSTDGECEANPVWMKNTCPLSCAKLEQCAVAPASAACARTFECPPKRDEADDCPRQDEALGSCSDDNELRQVFVKNRLKAATKAWYIIDSFGRYGVCCLTSTLSSALLAH